MSTPVVSVRHVSKRFSNGTLALSDLSLDIMPGEFVSLLGPSGCGKSTALRIIAGLGGTTEGTVHWPAAQDGAHGGKIGFVFQEPTLMPWRTVLGNVRLPLTLAGIAAGAARDRALSALETVGLRDFAAAYPRQLSGGMKMRVSIARALVTNPTILLMDEPFAALDEITRQKLNDDVLRLWQEAGLTVVFVTHSVYEAAYLSSRVVVMGARPGRIIGNLALDRPWPRTEAFRASPDYAALTRLVSEMLETATRAAA